MGDKDWTDPTARRLMGAKRKLTRRPIDVEAIARAVRRVETKTRAVAFVRRVAAVADRDVRTVAIDTLRELVAEALAIVGKGGT